MNIKDLEKANKILEDIKDYKKTINKIKQSKAINVVNHNRNADVYISNSETVDEIKNVLISNYEKQIKELEQQLEELGIETEKKEEIEDKTGLFYLRIKGLDEAYNYLTFDKQTNKYFVGNSVELIEWKCAFSYEEAIKIKEEFKDIKFYMEKVKRR